jgi:hypothetical protein
MSYIVNEFKFEEWTYDIMLIYLVFFLHFISVVILYRPGRRVQYKDKKFIETGWYNRVNWFNLILSCGSTSDLVPQHPYRVDDWSSF